MTALPTTDPFADDPTIDDGPTIGDPTPAPETPPAEPVSDAPSQADYDALQAQLTEFQTMREALEAQGVVTGADLTARLAAPTTDSLKAIFQEALGQRTPSTPVPAVPQGQLTAEAFQSMIDKRFAQFQAQQASLQYNDQAAIEASLKARILSDPRFDAIMQKSSFDEAWGGKKGGAAKALAILGDHLLYERGQKTPDGKYRPVIDTAAVGEVADSINTLLQELKAATLHELSSEPNGPEAPDAPDITETESILAGLSEGFDDLDDEAVKRQSKVDAAVKATFEKSYRAAAAAGGNLPASQAF